MPECVYKPCKVVFEQNKTGRKRIYCGDPHKLLAQRPHIVERTINCKYCGKLFTTRRSRKVYCCAKCQRAAGYASKVVSKTPEEIERDQRMKDARIEARVDASLNCTLHKGCLDAGKLPCWKCTKKNIVPGAWKLEPGMLYNEKGQNEMISPRGII